MQEHMEDVLACGLAIGQEQVRALTADAAAPQGCAELLRHAEQLRARVWRQVCQVGGVPDGHHEQMPGIDGLAVHERQAQRVAV